MLPSKRPLKSRPPRPCYYSTSTSTPDLLLLAAQKVLRSYADATTADSEKQASAEPLRSALSAVEDSAALHESLETMAQSDPDAELRELAASDLPAAAKSVVSSRTALYTLVASPPPSSLSALIELKAGIGGVEASRWTATLLRMYMRFAVRQGWKPTVLESVSIGGGVEAFKEALLEVKGDGAYAMLKREAGVHKIQRVPENDPKGRVQSSTAGVIVLPSDDSPVQEDTDDLYDMKDVKVEVMRSRGAGGQHVNKTESAIRLTHHPTGVTVSMQDSRSQHENRTKAFRLLRSRLLALRMSEMQASRRSMRLTQVQGTDRSDKIRSYNVPQSRVTDHRVPFTITGCADALEGGETLDFLLREVTLWEERENLKSIIADEG